jgi:hypothetical protein
VYGDGSQFKHARLAFFFLGAPASLAAVEGAVPGALFRFKPFDILLTVALTGVDGGLVEDAECMVWCASEEGWTIMRIANKERSNSEATIDER